MKKRFWLLALALALPIIFAGAHTEQRSSAQVNSEEQRRKIEEQFLKAMLVARDNYAGEVNFEKMTRASINGMMTSLDPHSAYFDPEQWDRFLNDQRSRYFGIGSVINQRSGKVFIISPTEGTASYRAGFRYGDHIVEIDGESTEGWPQAQVSSRLRGPEGTTVRVKVARLGVAEPLAFTFTRGAVPLPSIPNYFVLGNGVGYINLQRGFNTTTFKEMQYAMDELRKQGMTSLILDLRDNGGGLVDQAWRICNLFLYSGQKIVTLRGRAGAFLERDFAANNPSPDQVPIVILINRSSASASEIVAGALQDHDRARIVGENSFGKGLVQNPFQLADSSAIILTTGKYYTPSGRLIQREYSGRSFYDYYLQRGDKEAINRTDEKRTDSGRTVYGGGGIQPDVEEKVRFTVEDFRQQTVWIEPIFAFVRALTSGQVAELGEYKIEGPPNHHHYLQPNELLITDKIFAAFKKFLKEEKAFSAMEARADKEREFLKRQIRYELVTAAYGSDKAYQVLLEGDQQLKAAIVEIPKAKAMAEDVVRNRMATRGSKTE